MANFKDRMLEGEVILEATGPENLLVRERRYDHTTKNRIRLADSVTQATTESLTANIARLKQTEAETRAEREELEFILAEGLKLIEKEFPKSKKDEH